MRKLAFPKIDGLDLAPVHQLSNSPLGQYLGIYYLGIGAQQVGSGLDYQAKFAGNRRSGVLHGGVLSALLDETAGASALRAVNFEQSVATVDLRVDYMRPANVEQPIYCVSHCFKTTRRIAFIRAEAFHETPDQPVAIAVGTFMIGANRSVPNLGGHPLSGAIDGST